MYLVLPECPNCGNISVLEGKLGILKVASSSVLKPGAAASRPPCSVSQHNRPIFPLVNNSRAVHHPALAHRVRSSQDGDRHGKPPLSSSVARALYVAR